MGYTFINLNIQGKKGSIQVVKGSPFLKMYNKVKFILFNLGIFLIFFALSTGYEIVTVINGCFLTSGDAYVTYYYYWLSLLLALIFIFLIHFRLCPKKITNNRFLILIVFSIVYVLLLHLIVSNNITQFLRCGSNDFIFDMK